VVGHTGLANVMYVESDPINAPSHSLAQPQLWAQTVLVRIPTQLLLKHVSRISKVGGGDGWFGE